RVGFPEAAPGGREARGGAGGGPRGGGGDGGWWVWPRGGGKWGGPKPPRHISRRGCRWRARRHNRDGQAPERALRRERGARQCLQQQAESSGHSSRLLLDASMLLIGLGCHANGDPPRHRPLTR